MSENYTSSFTNINGCLKHIPVNQRSHSTQANLIQKLYVVQETVIMYY